MVHPINCILTIILTSIISFAFDQISELYWDLSFGTSLFYVASESVIVWVLPSFFISLQISIKLISYVLKNRNEGLWLKFTQGSGKTLGSWGTKILNTIIVIYTLLILNSYIVVFRNVMVVNPIFSLDTISIKYPEISELVYCETTSKKQKNGIPRSGMFIQMGPKRYISLNETVPFSGQSGTQLFEKLMTRTKLKTTVFKFCSYEQDKIYRY